MATVARPGREISMVAKNTKSRFEGWSYKAYDFQKKYDVIHHLNKYGFVIVEGDWEYTDHDFFKLAKLYNLGESYKSEFNMAEHREGVSKSGINQIGGLATGDHIVFNSNSEIPLHTDGSYLPIGSIQTTVLLCKQPALVGGETILFDSKTAFLKLKQDHSDLAELLTHQDIFRRRSTTTKSGKLYEYIGPAFHMDRISGVQTCFTLDVTADWDHSYNISPKAKDAVGYLMDLATNTSKFYLEFSLQKGHAIIFRNDQLSHGRLAFKQSDNYPRTLFRGLFENCPSI